MSDVQVAVGARATRIGHTPTHIPVFDPTESSGLIERSLAGEGVLYWAKAASLWIVARFSPKVENARGQVMQKEEKVDIHFKNHLYFLANNDPYVDEKRSAIETHPSWGFDVRPLEEISRENKRRQLEEVNRVLQSVQAGEETKGIIKALAPQLKQFSAAELAELFAEVSGKKEEAEQVEEEKEEKVVEKTPAPAPAANRPAYNGRRK